MRKLISVILVCLLVLSGYNVMAQGVQYFQGDVYDALRAAKSQNKILLVECYADWNYKSKWMHNMMNNSVAVTDFLSKNFVVWKIDTSTPGGAKFASDYKVTDYPSLYIFNQSGVVVNKIEKAMDVDEFINTLESDIFTLDGGNLWKIEQLEKYADAGDREKADEIFTEYLQKVGREQMLKKSSRWIFENRTITYYYSTAFDFILENRKEMSSTPSDSIYTRGIIHDVMHDYFMDAFLSGSITDTSEIQRLTQFSAAYLPGDEPIIFFPTVIKSYIEKDYDRYISDLEKLISMLPEEDGSKLAFTLSVVSKDGSASTKAAARAIVHHQMNVSSNPSTQASLEILYNSL